MSLDTKRSLVHTYATVCMSLSNLPPNKDRHWQCDTVRQKQTRFHYSVSTVHTQNKWQILLPRTSPLKQTRFFARTLPSRFHSLLLFYFRWLLHCMKSPWCLIFSSFKETERENQRSADSLPGGAMLVAFRAPTLIRHAIR